MLQSVTLCTCAISVTTTIQLHWCSILLKCISLNQIECNFLCSHNLLTSSDSFHPRWSKPASVGRDEPAARLRTIIYKFCGLIPILSVRSHNVLFLLEFLQLFTFYLLMLATFSWTLWQCVSKCKPMRILKRRAKTPNIYQHMSSLCNNRDPIISDQMSPALPRQKEH